MKKKLLMLLCVMFIGLTLVGCGEKKNEEKKDDKNETTENKEKKAADKEKEVKGKLVTNDKQIVFFQPENTYIVYKNDGEKITGHETYTDYASEESAKEALKGYTEADRANFADIKTDGQYVVVVYKDEEYKDYTLSLVKQAYKDYKIVK